MKAKKIFNPTGLKKMSAYPVGTRRPPGRVIHVPVQIGPDSEDKI